jgi:hypothetical protein
MSAVLSCCFVSLVDGGGTNLGAFLVLEAVVLARQSLTTTTGVFFKFFFERDADLGLGV